MTCVLQNEVFHMCRQLAILLATDQSRTKTFALQYRLLLMIASALVEWFECCAAANHGYTVLQYNSLVIRSDLHKQCVARLAVVYTQPQCGLCGLPTTTILAVIAVHTHVPRSR